MSLPVEPDFVVIKMGDGAGPEVFAITCGIQDVNVAHDVATSDRAVRDCAKPGEVPNLKRKASSKGMTITATGFIDRAQLVLNHAALGKVKNYKAEYYTDDGTDAGVLYGTYAGAFMMTNLKQGVPRDGQASVEFTLASHGAVPWTSAP
jgi:hypothetical protein